MQNWNNNQASVHFSQTLPHNHIKFQHSDLCYKQTLHWMCQVDEQHHLQETANKHIPPFRHGSTPLAGIMVDSQYDSFFTQAHFVAICLSYLNQTRYILFYGQTCYKRIADHAVSITISSTWCQQLSCRSALHLQGLHSVHSWKWLSTMVLIPR